MGLGYALTEMFQEAMPAFHDALDDFLANVRNDFHCCQPLTGMRNVRTQSIKVISEYLAALPTARSI